MAVDTGISDHIATAQITQPAAPWRHQAACRAKPRALDIPRHLTGEDRDRAIMRARWLCRSCPVLTTCRTWVLTLPGDLDPGGICAALTKSERSYLRGRQRNGAPSQ
jgi:hypothetical protein